MATEDELNRLAYEIRGAGLEVHRRIGPGCFESAYVPCFGYELDRRHLRFRTEVALTLHYETLTVSNVYRPDFIVEELIVVEIKALEKLAPVHARQLQTYLKLSGCPLGFVLNFGASRFLDDVIRRVNNFPEGGPRGEF